MRRYRVLIVDDESIIRQGLTKLIDRNAAEWEVAGEARNGQEALVELERLKPHLVMTDIRMPNMDGIELAREIRERAPDAVVVILTGYKDFEYAQAALRYGVLDFLLKPCPEGEIVRVLRHAADKIAERIAEQDNRLEEERVRDEHALRSIMLRLPFDSDRLDLIRNRLLDKELWLMKVETYFPASKSYGYNDMRLLHFAIANIAKELIERHQLRGTLLHISYDLYAIFLEGGKSGFFREAESTISRLLGIAVQHRHIGIVEDWRRLPEHIDRVSGANPPDASSMMERLEIHPAKITGIQNEIMSSIMLGQAEQVADAIGNRIAALRTETFEKAKLGALTLALALHEMIRKEFSSDGREPDLDGELDRVNEWKTAADASDWAERQKALFLVEFRQWIDRHNQNIVGRAVRYIEERYMGSCDLKEVANHVHLSANYFGNLFKKETGESFVNYVTRIRLDKAKALLGNTELKVFEVAARVGYDDPNYFTTVFRQWSGMSPSQYRKWIKEQASLRAKGAES